MRPDQPWGAAGKDRPDGSDGSDEVAEPGVPVGPLGSDGQRSSQEGPERPTLDTAVRRRRADRAFYLRLAGAIRQNTRALERLRQ